MSDPTAAEVVQIAEKFAAAMERLDALVPKGLGSNGVSTVSINAGGVGVWVAALLCAISFILNLVGALWVSSEFGTIRNENVALKQELQALKSADETMNAYINVLMRDKK